MRLRKQISTLIIGAALLCSAAPARGTYHLVIQEVFFGTKDCPNAQYVRLRMFSANQGFVAGKALATQKADGSSAGNFGVFDHNITGNINTGAPVLIGTSDAQALFGILFDQVAPGKLIFPAGRVCFADTIDCVAYGDFTGGHTGFGSPAVRPQLGMALVRVSQTHNNATDFQLGEPTPQNNAGRIGTLGQCPVATPPTPTPTAIAGCPGDCDGSGSVDINELLTLVNIALGNSSVAACAAGDTDKDGQISIDEILAAVHAALNSCPPG